MELLQRRSRIHLHNFTDIFYDSTNHIFCQIEKFFCPIKTLVLRPVKENTSGEFAEQILADLIRQGYSREELLEKFKQTQRKIRPAVEAMLAEADRVAESKSGGYSLEDVFGTEDEK